MSSTPTRLINVSIMTATVVPDVGTVTLAIIPPSKQLLNVNELLTRVSGGIAKTVLKSLPSWMLASSPASKVFSPPKE